MNRRKFIINGSRGLLAASLLPYARITHAQPAEPHFFVHLHAGGGVDSPLTLDPLEIAGLRNRGIPDSEFFYLYRDQDVIRHTGTTGRPMKLGISASPLAPFAKDICIINGVMMNWELPTHPGNTNYAISGSTIADAQAFAAQLAQALGNSPRGVGVCKLQYTFNSGDSKEGVLPFSLPPLSNDQVEAGSGSGKRERVKLSPNATKFFESRVRAGKGEAFQGSQIDLIRAVGYPSVKPILRNLRQNNPTVYGPAVECAAYFMTGSMLYAHLDLSDDSATRFPGDLDTHENHPLHVDTARNLFGMIAGIFQLFKSLEYPGTGKSLFDLTTFLYTTEFGRTPYVEEYSENGSDHNPRATSFFAAGKGIRGGQTIGASHLWGSHEVDDGGLSRLQSLPFSFKDQRPVSPEEVRSAISGKLPFNFGICRELDGCFDYIYPETVMKTIAQNFGLAKGTPLTQYAQTLPAILKV